MTTPSQHARFRLPRIVRPCAAVAVTAAVAGLLPASPGSRGSGPDRCRLLRRAPRRPARRRGPGVAADHCRVGPAVGQRGVLAGARDTPGVFRLGPDRRRDAQGREHGASVLLVLGQTPRFHSTRPGAPGAYGPGATAMPTQGGLGALREGGRAAQPDGVERRRRLPGLERGERQHLLVGHARADGDPDGLDPDRPAIGGFRRAADQPRVGHPAQQPADAGSVPSTASASRAGT